MSTECFGDEAAFAAWCETGDGLTWDEWIETMDEPGRPFRGMFETPPEGIPFPAWRPMIVAMLMAEGHEWRASESLP
jgi:hypothetical protein